MICLTFLCRNAWIRIENLLCPLLLDRLSVLNSSFNEELEPTGDAVVCASPERIAAAEAAHPPHSHHSLDDEDSFDHDSLCQLTSTARNYYGAASQTLPRENYENSLPFSTQPEQTPFGQESVTILTEASATEEAIMEGHVETEEGVVDSHDGEVFDAFDIYHGAPSSSAPKLDENAAPTNEEEGNDEDETVSFVVQ